MPTPHTEINRELRAELEDARTRNHILDTENHELKRSSMSDKELLRWSLDHFKALDESNACMHTAPVRYSPITFRLAEAIGTSYESARKVLTHKGKYEEDRGR